MKNELKGIIRNSSLSNTELKKVIVRVLLKTNDMMRVKGMTEDVMRSNYSSLKPEEVENLIEVLKDNQTKDNQEQNDYIEEIQKLPTKHIAPRNTVIYANTLTNAPNEIMATVELLKSKILYLEQQLKQSNIDTKIKVEDNVYIINNGEVVVIPKKLFNMGDK